MKRTEILIGMYATGWVRNYLGDVLVVILLYAFAKLIDTGITRAKKVLVMVGTKKGTGLRRQKCNGNKEKYAAERALGDRKVTMEELLEKPYWIIDILPKQVSKDSAGQYFAIENFFLKEQLTEIKKKHIGVILKLNCYVDISIDGEKNPAPEQIRDIMTERYVYIMFRDSMILSEPDDTHMTVFNPDEELLGLIREISSLEGLFVWKNDDQPEGMRDTK